MALPASPLPPARGVFDLIEGGGEAIGDGIRPLLYLVGGEAGDAAATGLGEEAGAAAIGTASAIGGAALAIVLAIALLIVVIVLAVFALFGKALSDKVGNVPWIGGALQYPIDQLTGVGIAGGRAAEAVMIYAWRNGVHELTILLTFMLSLLHVPTLSQVQTVIHTIAAPVTAGIGALEKTVSDLYGQVQNVEAHLTSFAHALWSRLATLEGEIIAVAKDVNWLLAFAGWVISQIGTLWANIHALIHEVTTLALRVLHLEREYTVLQHEVRVLEADVAATMQRLETTMVNVAQVGEMAAIMVLLVPLIETGPEGIANLASQADDPCYCFTIPNGRGAIVEALVADLVMAHGA